MSYRTITCTLLTPIRVTQAAATAPPAIWPSPAAPGRPRPLHGQQPTSGLRVSASMPLTVDSVLRDGIAVLRALGRGDRGGAPFGATQAYELVAPLRDPSLQDTWQNDRADASPETLADLKRLMKVRACARRGPGQDGLSHACGRLREARPPPPALPASVLAGALRMAACLYYLWYKLAAARCMHGPTHHPSRCGLLAPPPPLAAGGHARPGCLRMRAG